MMKRKFNILSIILILTFKFGVGCSKVNFSNIEKRIDNNLTHGTILSFNSNKCNGCGGWIIKIGRDTIKTDYLPLDSTTLKKIKYPQSVNIVVGGIIAKHESVDYNYYKIEFVELILNENCANLIWYRFIGGRPNTYFIRVSEKVAKEWGFEIHYEYGSCGNTSRDRIKSNECQDKSKRALDCLRKIYGDNWKKEFLKIVNSKRFGNKR